MPNVLAMTAGPVMSHRSAGRDMTAAVRRQRVTTIVGIGGIGKTRLALEVARGLCGHFDGGVFFGDVARPNSAAELLQDWAALFEALPEADPVVAIVRTTGRRRTLLVVDAAEHHAPAVREAVEVLLTAVSSVSVLLTSRVPINCTGEHLYARFADGRAVRVPRSDLRDRRGEDDTVYVFGRRTAVVIPSRGECAVRAALDAQLARS